MIVSYLLHDQGLVVSVERHDAVQIDTGTDLMHPDIQGNLWTNPAETKASGASKSNGYQNGRDDDGNGKTSSIAVCSAHSCMLHWQSSKVSDAGAVIVCARMLLSILICRVHHGVSSSMALRGLLFFLVK